MFTKKNDFCTENYFCFVEMLLAIHQLNCRTQLLDIMLWILNKNLIIYAVYKKTSKKLILKRFLNMFLNGDVFS